MATRIKDLPAEEIVLSGNGSCASCPSTLALRMVGKALGSNVIMLLTPSCTVASMGLTPQMAFNYPAMNVCFATAACSASGVVYALEAQAMKGRLQGELPTVITWTGDGGTYDIGFQALSAAAERNDHFIHFCYNNEAYSNTGVQRSAATPAHAVTTTTPSGKVEGKKNMPLLMLDHRVPYMATASLAYPADLYDKVVKAKSVKGLKYIEIFAPCYPGWRFESKDMIKLARLAVRSGVNLLWEAENGSITRFSNPTKGLVEGTAQPRGLEEYFSAQGRFKHVMTPDKREAFLSGVEAEIRGEMALLKKRTLE
ncbi:MAG: thiamine pyrophosphate-dependent enzyme [Peptococcaceae bacterium]|nr:thiamine pyrophosphate-dependent enzyme [Peptococcaceae bacterium]MDR2736717.1 pyruvate synthase [Gracilibacteraceae bacterium]